MKEADRMGSLDSNIKGYVPNDIDGFLASRPSISAIILNGTCETKNVFEQNISEDSLKWNVSHQRTPSCRVSPKMLEIFSKSCRILQDFWNKPRILGDSQRMSEDALLLEPVRQEFHQVE
jgi:hypothetical protein